jgi:hypothetical protein
MCNDNDELFPFEFRHIGSMSFVSNAHMMFECDHVDDARPVSDEYANYTDDIKAAVPNMKTIEIDIPPPEPVDPCNVCDGKGWEDASNQFNTSVLCSG